MLLLCISYSGSGQRKSPLSNYTLHSGRSSWVSFWNNSACRTVSNALLKSRAMTITYGLLDNRWVIECKMAMSAAVVDPVGRNIYWLQDCKIQEVSDDDTVECSAEDGCDWWYWVVVRVPDGVGGPCDWPDKCSLPLMWFCRRSYGSVEEPSDWFGEERGSCAQEPCKQVVQPHCCDCQLIEHQEDLSFRHRLIIITGCCMPSLWGSVLPVRR